MYILNILNHIALLSLNKNSKKLIRKRLKQVRVN